MSALPYLLDDSPGARATLGLIVLQVDETIERDMQRCLPDRDLAIHVSRVPSGAELTVDTIADMERDLPEAAGLLPQTPEYDVVAYACTSGTTLIGAERVAGLVGQGCRARHVTDPLTASIAAFRHLGVTSIGLVSPYIEEVAQPVQAAFEAAGIQVRRSVSFGEKIEANVARISAASIAKAATEVSGGVDAVFLSCTNLRTLDLVPGLEAELHVPVISSNLALFWHMARLAGAFRPVGDLGALFASEPS